MRKDFQIRIDEYVQNIRKAELQYIPQVRRDFEFGTMDYPKVKEMKSDHFGRISKFVRNRQSPKSSLP